MYVAMYLHRNFRLSLLSNDFVCIDNLFTLQLVAVRKMKIVVYQLTMPMDVIRVLEHMMLQLIAVTLSLAISFVHNKELMDTS